MIRGPVLPQARERLWSIVANRLDAIESGLELVLEALDCSSGLHGPIDGLCRDAAGAPVLVALAVDGDGQLLPRLAAAADFVERVGGAMATAVPEGSFCAGAAPRLLVLGSASSAAALQAVARLRVPALEVCRLEPFRLAGAERIAVCRVERPAEPGRAAPAAAGAPGAAPAAAPSGFAADDAHYRAIVGLCARIDPGVRIDGDRFRRRITWHGHPLGQLTCADGALLATAEDGVEQPILTAGDARRFADRVMRRYAEVARLRPVEPAAEGGAEPADEAPPRAASRVDADRTAARPPVRTLRSAIAEALLSPEEFAALAEPDEAALPNDSPD